MSLFFKKKVAKNDFTEANLPKNRKEVFIDVLKIRWGMLLRLGLLILLFSVPLIICILFKDITISGVYEDISSQIEAGTITSAEGLSEIFAYTNMFNIFEMICLVIVGIGAAGGIRVTRQLCWGEAVFFHQDFFDGIKMNGKHYALIFFLIGLFNFLNTLVYNSLSINGSTIYQIMSILPTALCLTLFLEIAEMMMGMVPIYSNKFRHEVKNGFLLYIKSMPKTLLMTLIMISIPMALKFVNLIQVKYIGLLVFIIVIVPYLMMGMFLYESSVFDKYININNYPEIFDKGVYRDEADKKAIHDKYYVDESVRNGEFLNEPESDSTSQEEMQEEKAE